MKTNMNMTGQEKALLFNFREKSQLQAVQMALFLAQVQCRIVSKQEYGVPLKILAADEKAPFAAYNGPELDGQMMVFVELGEDKLESVLSLLHSNPACGKIPYKAVLTQTNQNWNGIDLLEELRKEHAAMELARGTV